LSGPMLFWKAEDDMGDATPERDYVLGTHDEEIARLGLQHRVWRPRALDAWRRAGFTVGQTLLDVGCGPGHATLDLAEMVGPTGWVVAVDRSRRFLEALDAACRRHGLENVETVEVDLDEAPLPAAGVHGAWCRWVLAFVKRPRDLLSRIHGALRPGGTLVIHEYFDYSTWRLAPRCPEMEEFVRAVMESWRASGGEPDVGLDLPRCLEELHFEARSVRPILEVIGPSDFFWQWPKTFLQVGLDRLVGLGQIGADRARAIANAFAGREREPGTFMITPAVLEIIAVRR
jgi:SAM-dependent methyltransferase